MSYGESRGGGIVRGCPAMCSRGQGYLLAELIYVSESSSTGSVVHLGAPSALPPSGC
jgi:hypothetical protein